MLTLLQQTILPKAPLGQKSPYPKCYDPSLLFPVERDLQRRAMNFPDVLFHGYDVWHADELLWRNLKGKPVRVYGCLVVPADSRNLLESKSVKLYLNSLNHERYSSMEEVRSIIVRDLSEISESKVQVFFAHESFQHGDRLSLPAFRCLDGIDVEINQYQRTPELLTADFKTAATDKVVSHVFKAHCLCTGQPDMGSIFIEYHGPKIDDAGLLAYLVSYAEHAGFSENCIEQIFVDILDHAKPQKLVVHGLFTTRGGIRVNPYRSTHEMPFDRAGIFHQ